MSARVAVALATLGCLSGCPERKRACAPGAPARLSFRDGAGTLVRSLKDSPDGKTLDLCDAAHQRTATVSQEGVVVTVLDARGARVLRIEILPNGDLEAAGPNGPRLRVHSERGETRVLQADGVAFGAMTVREGGGANLFDKASVPIGSVAARDRDQVVLDTDGSTRGFVSPSAAPVAAGVFAFEGLSPDERMALYHLLAKP